MVHVRTQYKKHNNHILHMVIKPNVRKILRGRPQSWRAICLR